MELKKYKMKPPPLRDQDTMLSQGSFQQAEGLG